jgi:hypothetical protein
MIGLPFLVNLQPDVHSRNFIGVGRIDYSEIESIARRSVVVLASAVD